MSRSITLGGTLAVALLLVGAGCNAPVKKDVSAVKNSAKTSEQEKNTEVEYTTKKGGAIELKATAKGTRQVTFEWELPSNGNEPKNFFLLRGDNEDLKHDQNTFWFRQDGSRRAATWVNLPPGEQNFRICAGDDAETCSVYSDVLTVNVLSGPVQKTEEDDDQYSDEETYNDDTSSEEAEDMNEEESATEDDSEMSDDMTEAENDDTATSTDDTVMDDESEEASTDDTTMEVPADDATSTEEMVVEEETTTEATSTESGTETTETVEVETTTTTQS